MKNLKRALSFALASVMVIGMMVVGAGAAFTDADKIVNDEAVDTMVTLGVLSGKGDGSYYDPAGTLTRAEAAKIIVYVLHGGKAPVIGTKTTPTYSDIKGNWAEAYIEYCSAQGIIAGWDGKFNPAGELTGTAFAKMLMVAMGYNAEVFGFVGADYEMNVNIEANKIGLYTDLEDIDPTANLSRDDAALMAYNALFAGTMEKTYNHNITTGAVTNGYDFDTAETLYATKFSGAAKTGALLDVEWDATKKEYIYNVDGVGTNLRSTKDYTELFQLPVNVLWNDADKDGAFDAGEKVYGLYTEAEAVVEGIIHKLPTTIAVDATKIKYDNVEYELDAQAQLTPVYAFLDAGFTGVVLTDVNADFAHDTFVAYDTDDDGKVNMIVLYATYLDQVTFAGKENIVFASGTTNNYETDKNHIEAGLKKDDYVMVTKALNTVDGKYVVAKAPVVTGKVEAIKSTNQIQVNGTWYKIASNTDMLANTYDLVVVNGYVLTYTLKSTASTELLVALKADSSPDAITGTYKTKVMFLDGTTAVIEAEAAATEGYLYTYEIEDGVYELTALHGTNNKAGYDKVDADSTFYFNATTDKLVVNATNYRIADDATVIVRYNTNATVKAKVMTGAELKKMASNIGTALGWVLLDEVNGYETAKVIALNTTEATLPAATGTTVYGYVVSDVVTSKDADANVWYAFDLWTGTETISVKEKTSTAATKGAIVAYKNMGNGIVDDTVAQTMTDAAVLAYAGNDIKVKLANYSDVEIKINTKDDDGIDNTVIFYVDVENYKAVEGGAIALADEVVDGEYTPNVKYVLGTETNIKVLVVDYTNETGVAAFEAPVVEES